MTRADDKLNVLILAAGLGTRLRPLTSEIPKPLVRVYDKSILEIQMERAKSLGDVRLHANAHYLADQIVSEGERLGFEKVWVETPEILGTAGPLRRIYAAGYRGGLLIMNGDAYCNFDLGAFVRNARNRCEVALLAVDFPKVNTFRVGADGCLAGVAGRFGADTGTAAPHLKGLIAGVQQAMKEKGVESFRTSGDPESGWIVVDYIDVVVHVFSPEARAYYALEKIWKDSPAIV